VRRQCVSILLMAGLLQMNSASVQASGGTLFEGFQSPPAEAKPQVWWHWMSGNVTEEGVRRDLEWIQRVGIGGVHNFDVAFDFGGDFDTPTLVDHPLTYLTPEWREVFRRSVELADWLGLEFTIASAPGWSETGGPWVTAREGMKKLVWTETYIEGGTAYMGRLARPSSVSGSFQNIPHAVFGTPKHRGAPIPTFYADVAAVAYRAPAGDVACGNLKAQITSSADASVNASANTRTSAGGSTDANAKASTGSMDAARLWLCDGDLVRAVPLAFGDGPEAWVQFAFPRAQTIQGVTIALGRAEPREADALTWLEASDDGRSFHKVSVLSRVA
jgi:hypothetical protein